MHALYFIVFEIDLELICYFEQDLFPTIVVFFIFFYSTNKNIFSSYVLFFSFLCIVPIVFWLQQNCVNAASGEQVQRPVTGSILKL